jgi:squalene-associated FAD-dependent desaturase
LKQANTLIVGGGWAGLAAGVELSSQGSPVVVMEAAAQLGGRARTICYGDQQVDNGQHLLIGGYRETLRLLKVMGIDEAEHYFRQPLALPIRRGGKQFTLQAFHLPAPLHIGAGLLTAQGLNPRQKFSALRFATRLFVSGFSLEQDCSVAELLNHHGQDQDLIDALWLPLCLGAMNTTIEKASARVFLRVLKEAFSHRRCDSDLLIPKTDLNCCFPLLARVYIEQQGGKVLLNKRVTAISVTKGDISGVVVDNKHYSAKHVILATPPWITRNLLQPHSAFSKLTNMLNQLTFNPITTVYLQYPEATRLPQAMVGLAGRLGQWVFDRSIAGQPGLMAVVISGPGPHMEIEKRQLIAQVSAELALHFSHWPATESGFVIREKRATFSCDVDIDRLRPASKTPVTGCLLAGDYTNTGYPATLEGAVVSGVQCANLINQQS